jgi:hypothetical protein
MLLAPMMLGIMAFQSSITAPLNKRKIAAIPNSFTKPCLRVCPNIWPPLDFIENPFLAGLNTFFAARAARRVFENNVPVQEKPDAANGALGTGLYTVPTRRAVFCVGPNMLCADLAQFFLQFVFHLVPPSFQ